MAPKKKKKRPEAAQQLIDSLLDEKTPTQGVVVPFTFSKAPPTPKDSDDVDLNGDFELSLEDEGSSRPPFDGTKPLVTQMNQSMPEVDSEFS
ncbi:MAG: hypothetical protein V4692_06090, partial [Bdellovibrionota bacterium]